MRSWTGCQRCNFKPFMPSREAHGERGAAQIGPLTPRPQEGSCLVLSISPLPARYLQDARPPLPPAEIAGTSTRTGIVISDSPVSFPKSPWLQKHDIPRASAEGHGHPDLFIEQSIGLAVDESIQLHASRPASPAEPRVSRPSLSLLKAASKIKLSFVCSMPSKCIRIFQSFQVYYRFHPSD